MLKSPNIPRKDRLSMVQQLSLTASLKQNNLEMLLLTLKALTGHNAQPMHQHTVILKPRYLYSPDPSPGKVAQFESYRLRMTRMWEVDYPIDVSESLFGDSVRSRNNSLNESIWTLQLSDIPAGGKTQVSIQNMYETTIYQTDDMIGYIDELGYIHETEYWVNGVRFYYDDVIIEVMRVFIADNDATRKVDSINQSFADCSTETDSFTPLKLLSSDGRFFMRAMVNVTDVTDLESVATGTRQLDHLKRELEEVVTLRIPDRTSMDSRINSRIASGNSSVNLNRIL
ncbi:hypothetical protein CANINC_003712 [Pichia inconspicua]|uniref:Mediator of RNA polymerase II transcription subunit 18 n=1 Tax=Pichia inconspicua TaxID=52247 RepID=A0A4T0WY30_9ASCO|nr:hypothetical protein CANINC_003712 [[Candida] inconspicua]